MSKKIAIVGDVHLSSTNPKSRKDVDYTGALLEKLSQIYDNSDAVIFLGDLFTTPTVPVKVISRFASFLYQKGKPTYSILGNHDVPFLNKMLLSKTSIGLMTYMNYFSVCPDSFSVFGYNIDVVPFDNSIKMPESKNSDILLGHCFFDSSLDKKFSLLKEDVEKSDYKYIFLGHDHSPYEDININNTILVRNGSVCRDSSCFYNLCNEETRVSYSLLTVENANLISVEKKYVKILPVVDVFVSDVLNISNRKSKINNEFGNLFNIDVILDKFGSAKADNTSSVLSVMNEFGVCEDIIFYITKKYNELGMVLK